MELAEEKCGLELLCAAAEVVAQDAEPVVPAQDAESEGRASAESGGGAQKRPREQSSRFIGVCWDKAGSSWRAQMKDPQTKHTRRIGSYASEEDAARAYDHAAVQARGPDVERNFPDEAIRQSSSSEGEEEQRGNRVSRYLGVSWSNSKSAWLVRLWDPRIASQRQIGSYASEKDAGRAYDYAAVRAHGPGTKLNFPGEIIREPPETLGEGRKKQQTTSRYLGVRWHKGNSVWFVELHDRRTKHQRRRHIGSFASEEDAARAYDHAAVRAYGPGAKRNFPGEDLSELP
ncbi:hypothetical protein FOA52_015372 [Chlamydomonas sp. UWO 241]|nr:hypothetical protein FOA52_015372 [Chlamydomonas sp. UWO 241]